MPAIAMWEALSLLALLPLAAAYECTVTSHEDMTNYGERAPPSLGSRAGPSCALYARQVVGLQR